MGASSTGEEQALGEGGDGGEAGEAGEGGEGGEAGEGGVEGVEGVGEESVAPGGSGGVERMLGTGIGIQGELEPILEAMGRSVPGDLRSYRTSTLARAVERRMVRVQAPSAAAYAELIAASEAEARLLLGELRVAVTSFFRDPDAFRALEEQLTAELLRRGPGEPFRAWIPGCCTGEEAYSIAMLLMERSQAADVRRRLQLFGSDTGAEALDMARIGFYPTAALDAVSPERRSRFFVEEHGGYRVTRELRDMISFAEHDVLVAPPFSRLDLLSCRNLFIYLQPRAQRQLLQSFHFALRENGLLFLGNTEAPGDGEDLFEPVSQRWRIYRRRPGLRPALVQVPASTLREPAPRGGEGSVRPAAPERERPGDLTIAALVEAYTPASVLVGPRGEVIYVHGDTSPYLALPTGAPTHDLVAMVRASMRARVRAAIARARSAGGPVTVTGGRCRVEGVVREVAVAARLLAARDGEEQVLVSFLPGAESAPAPASPDGASEDPVVRHLERELEVTRVELQRALEDIEAVNHDLQSAHQEASSIHEELQSANEELKSAAEEMESLNEELTSANEQLSEKVQALQGINDDLSNLLGATEVAIVFLDMRLAIKRFTPPARRLLNLLPSDMGRLLREISPNVADPTLLDDARAVLRGEAVLERSVAGPGATWFIRRVLPYRRADGQVDGAVISLIDVTALKYAEEALRVSEERFRSAIRAANIVVCQQDTDLRYTWAYNVPDATAESLLGKTDFDLLGAPEAERLVTVKRRVLDTGMGARSDVEVASAGARRLYHAVMEPTRNGAGLVVGVTSVAMDITDRKVAEKRMEFQARALDQVEDAVIAVDLQGRATYLNRAAEQQYGIRVADVVGRPLREAVYTAAWASPEAERVAALALHREGRWRGELEHVRRDGRRISVDVSSNLLRDADGHVQGYLSVIRDVSASKRAEAERRALETKMREAQKLESLGVLAGGIAHDFNNILLGVLTNAATAIDALPSDAPLRPCLEDIERAARRAADLCRQMLAYAGRGRFDPEPLDLSSLAQETLHLVRSSLARRAAVSCELPTSLPSVLGDPTQLRQVIMNLIINASEALPGGTGDIRIRTGLMDCDRAYLAGAMLGEHVPEDTYVYVEVQDTGAGMDEEAQRRLFEPFFTTKFAGRGLGLSAALGIVRSHRGAIRLTSAPGRGTTFRVLLPARKEPSARRDTPAPAAPQAAGADATRRALLLVDDDPIVRSAARRMLEAAGFRVIDAGGGVAAMALLSASREIAAAVVDLTMPEMSGEETLRALRRIRPDLPVILISGWDEGEAAALLEQTPHITAFVRKPWTRAELLETLEGVLGSAAARAPRQAG